VGDGERRRTATSLLVWPLVLSRRLLVGLRFINGEIAALAVTLFCACPRGEPAASGRPPAPFGSGKRSLLHSPAAAKPRPLLRALGRTCRHLLLPLRVLFSGSLPAASNATGIARHQAGSSRGRRFFSWATTWRPFRRGGRGAANEPWRRLRTWLNDMARRWAAIAAISACCAAAGHRRKISGLSGKRTW